MSLHDHRQHCVSWILHRLLLVVFACHSSSLVSLFTAVTHPPQSPQWYQYPVIYFNTPTVAGLATWSDVIVGAIFFAAFGFGTEAMALYSRAAELLGITRIACLSRSARSKTAVANGRQTGL